MYVHSNEQIIQLIYYNKSLVHSWIPAYINHNYELIIYLDMERNIWHLEKIWKSVGDVSRKISGINTYPNKIGKVTSNAVEGQVFLNQCIAMTTHHRKVLKFQEKNGDI